MAEGEGKAISLVFRIAALALSVAAPVVMGTASQLAIADGRRGSPSSYVVSYSQYSAFVYFVVAGVISAVCSATALYLSAVREGEATIGSLPLMPLLDAVAQGLLFSAAGAAFATRAVACGAAGPSGSGGGGGGGSVCDSAGAFCSRVSTASAVGALAAVVVAAAALARDACRRSSGGRRCGL